MSLYENINKQKRKGTSRSKKNSTISDKEYENMKKGFPKYEKGGKVESLPVQDSRNRSEVHRMQDEAHCYNKGGKVKSAAWKRKAGKNKSGGLNEKGRKSYERENPGSNLKAPQPEGGSRKKSFCARMGGMKKKLTSSKTANDPNSRINKSLKKWKC
tara:strand:- start:1858 stop:2328 length:471 start_codon:yes stop_codon:yes gene_type:complete